MVNWPRIFATGVAIAGIGGFGYCFHTGYKTLKSLNDEKYLPVTNYKKISGEIEFSSNDQHPSAIQYTLHLRDELKKLSEKPSFAQLCDEYHEKERKKGALDLGVLASMIIGTFGIVISANSHPDRKYL